MHSNPVAVGELSTFSRCRRYFILVAAIIGTACSAATAATFTTVLIAASVITFITALLVTATVVVAANDVSERLLRREELLALGQRFGP